MKEKKDIEQFFQNKFEDYEVNPPEIAWENIKEKLQKKKKRRVIPFWCWPSGVAALFVIGLLVFNNNYTVEIHPINEVVVETNDMNKTKSNDLKIVHSQDLKENEPNSSEGEKSNGTEKTQKNTTIATIEKEPIKTKKTAVSNEQNNAVLRSSSVIVSSSRSTRDKKNKHFNKNENAISSTKTDLTNENAILQKQENIVQNNSISNKNKSNLNKENSIVQGKIAMKNNDNIATKGGVIISKDSAAIATVEPNALEELLKEKEKQISQEQKMNRWQVTPNLAPIYFGSFADGSPLDSKLDDNAKTYNSNLSYGVAVDYSVTKKLKIRTGINSFAVDYNTNNIAFFQNGNARKMENVAPTVQGSFIEIVPIKNLNTSFGRQESEQNTGILNQRMGYIEMPLEVSYKILDQKFGIDLIGGMSTMFLNENAVFLQSDEMNMKIGEATNLNPVHFSTNFGVGLHYGFFSRFRARIEPTFKYQLSTFSSDSQNFRPYIFGIYSGVSYSF